MNLSLVGSMVCRRSASSQLSLLLRTNNGVTGLGVTNSPRWLTTSSSFQKTSSVNPNEDFWLKNQRLSRPMSPHLTIYKLQITSLLSVTHRGTGMALAGLNSAFAIGMLLASSPYPHYIELLQSSHLGGAFLFSVKFLLTFPLTFHFLNGIRHLAWDMGKGFDLKTLNTSGMAVVAGSVLSSLVFAAM